VEEMKIYMAGETGQRKRELMVLNQSKNRLLSYFYIIASTKPHLSFEIIKEINENQDK